MSTSADTPLQQEVWDRIILDPPRIDHSGLELVVEWEQIDRFYAPLARKLSSRAEESDRIVVAIAGAPGSGKSAFGAILVSVINAIADAQIAALVGLDGWHYPNDYLESHSITIDGRRVALRRIKGAPESFDVETFARFLARVRTEVEVRYPIYSRELHDPVPDAGRVLAQHRIVIVEGNYLLLDESPWDELQQLLAVRIFVSAPEQDRVQGLRERHLRVGRSEEYTEKQIHSVDLPNGRRVIRGLARADVVVEKKDPRRIERVQWAA